MQSNDLISRNVRYQEVCVQVKINCVCASESRRQDVRNLPDEMASPSEYREDESTILFNNLFIGSEIMGYMLEPLVTVAADKTIKCATSPLEAILAGYCRHFDVIHATANCFDWFRASC